MKSTYLKMIFLWLAMVLLITIDRVVYSDYEGIATTDGFVYCSCALGGIISMRLWKKEVRLGTKFTFLNISIWLIVNAILSPMFNLSSHLFSLSNAWWRIGFYEYNSLLYFLLLFVSVCFLALDQILTNQSLVVKYTLVLISASVVWGINAFPYLSDVKVLSKQPIYLDYVLIRESAEKLKHAGDQNPTSEAIMKALESLSTKNESELGRLPERERERRITEILPYVAGLNGTLLFYSPLWKSCASIAVACVFVLMGLLMCQYVANKQVGAYLEKLAWCFVVYCVCESLHQFLFASVSDNDVQRFMETSGQVISTGGILTISGLLLVRLRFIESVEGKYYERRLLDDASRITRWRDRFDIWILKQFMNAAHLERRFAAHRRQT
jgi:hypothetical protein